jgi:DNA gyrase/topoisomerase IV subunit A
MSHESAFNRRTKELEKEFHQEELAELNAKLARLTALLEDRKTLVTLIKEAFGEAPGEFLCCEEHSKEKVTVVMKDSAAERIADRIKAHLMEQK